MVMEQNQLPFLDFFMGDIAHILEIEQNVVEWIDCDGQARAGLVWVDEIAEILDHYAGVCAVRDE